MEVEARDINRNPTNGRRSVLGMPSSTMDREWQELTTELWNMEQTMKRYRERLAWLSKRIRRDKSRIIKAIVAGERAWIFTCASRIDAEEALSPAEKVLAKQMLEKRQKWCRDPEKPNTYILWVNAEDVAMTFYDDDFAGPPYKGPVSTGSGDYQGAH